MYRTGIVDWLLGKLSPTPTLETKDEGCEARVKLGDRSENFEKKRKRSKGKGKDPKERNMEYVRVQYL